MRTHWMVVRFCRSAALIRVSTIILFAATFVIACTSVSASACPGDNEKGAQKDQTLPEGCRTQVFRRTYDDVFQATTEALERKGQILDTVEKARGIATYKAHDVRMRIFPYVKTSDCRIVIELRIEPVAPTDHPQTRVTVNVTDDGSGPKACRKPYQGCFDSLFSDIQKVLATYN